MYIRRQAIKRYFLSLLVFLFFSFSGCGFPPSKPLNIDIIELGMSKQYISSVLKAPDRVVGKKVFSGIFV